MHIVPNPHTTLWLTPCSSVCDADVQCTIATGTASTLAAGDLKYSGYMIPASDWRPQGPSQHWELHSLKPPNTFACWPSNTSSRMQICKDNTAQYANLPIAMHKEVELEGTAASHKILCLMLLLAMRDR